MAIGKHLSDKNPDGTALGQSATDLISFYGATPVAQRAVLFRRLLWFRLPHSSA
jgi:hypothetical protein